MKIYKIISIMILFTFFISCEKNANSKDEQVLKINVVDELNGLDPRKARDLNALAIMKMIYEGLTRVSENGEIENAILESYEVSDNKRNYVFHLKKTKWSDGSDVTAYDFVNSWMEALAPSFPSPMSYKLFIIKGAKEAKEGRANLDNIGIKAIDKYTIEIELEKPASYFLEILSMPISFPVATKLDSKICWEEDENKYLGNGPFRISKWKHNDQINLVKNENYYDKNLVKLNQICLYMVSAETELGMFETNNIDIAGSPFSDLPSDALKNVSSFKEYKTKPYLGTSFLRINYKWLRKNIDKKSSRENFLNHLYNNIDRKAIVTHLLYGKQGMAYGLVPSMPVNISEMGLDNLKQNNEDFPKIVKVLFVNNDRNYHVAQILQRHWEKSLNIKIELQPIERKVYFMKVFSGDYELAMGSWIADFNDPINFLEVFKYKDNGINNTSWENKEYIDLLNKADICIDNEKRLQLLTDAHDIILKEKPIIPLYHLNMCFLQNSRLKNVSISSVGHVDFKKAFFEK